MLLKNITLSNLNVNHMQLLITSEKLARKQIKAKQV